MGKFVVHGVLIEEPKRSTTSNGIDCITLLVEEKFRTAYNKEVINIYSVDFMGKAVNCVPENMRLIGCPVVITGGIRSREYKGKYYNDLSGDTLTIINTSTFALGKGASAEVPMREIADRHEGEIVGANLDDLDIPDDDLPF